MTAGKAPSGLDGGRFLARLRAQGFDFFSGVPCSLATRLFRALEGQDEVPYVPAVREDEAVAMAAGAWMAGRSPVVVMQNSGLGNALNAITSLSAIYELPFLLLVTWRGFEGRDAPEHMVIGRILPDLLDLVGFARDVLDPGRLEEQLAAARTHVSERRLSALIVKEGLLS